MSELITQAGQLRTIAEIKTDLQNHKLRAAKYIVEIGKDLRDAKALLGHGEWLPFLREAGFSARTAQNYMRLAEAANADGQLAQLPYSKALALLDAPEEVRQQEGIEDKSAAEIRRLTKELEAQSKRADEAEQLRRESEKREQAGWSNAYEQQALAEAAEKEKRQLQERLDEMAAHPVTVEVAPPDYAQLKDRLREAEQAAAEAEERAAAMLDPAPAEDGPQDVLRIQDALEAANDFALKCWCLPFMGTAFAAMDERERNSYRVLIRSVASLCARALETIDGADVIEGAAI